MKILLTVHLFLPDYFSGTEILTLHTAQELQRRGHHVHVFTAYPAPPAFDIADSDRFDSYQYQGITVTRFMHTHRPMGVQSNVAELEYNNALVAKRFDQLITEFQPDVVHFFHLMRLSASVIDVCQHRSIPTVLTPTDFWFVCPTSQLRLTDGSTCAGPDGVGANCILHMGQIKFPGALTQAVTFLPKPILRSVVQMAIVPPFNRFGYASLAAALSRRQCFLKDRLNQINRVLVPTRIMLHILQKYGLQASRTTLTSYGIQLPKDFARKDARVAPLTLGIIGMGEHKGGHILVQALSQMPTLEVYVKIYGRTSDFPDYAEKLKQLALGDSRVKFCGSFPNDQIGAILCELDALVVPSLWFENAPLVIYSAQAARVPVIGSDVAGIAELVTHGDNGLLFAPGDVQALASILRNLSENPSEFNRLSKNARPPKSINVYVDELLAVYADLISQKMETV
jgi:glycosyltransferase involved in cell wall biosynthesis